MNLPSSWAPALDPTRSYWQRWSTPIMRNEAARVMEAIERAHRPLCSPEVMRHLFIPSEATDADILTTAIILHARCRAERAGRPLYVLDETAAHALANTDLPENEAIGDIRLPHEGLYIEVPASVGMIDDAVSGQHEIEGIHVAQDVSSEGTPCVAIVVIGKAKGSRLTELGFSEPNDSVRFTMLAADTRIESKRFTPIDRAATRIALNLVWALEGGYLRLERVTPPSPKSPGKIKKLERRGHGLHPYTIVHLGRKAEDARERGGEERSETGRTVRAHGVRGHWRSYWTLDPAGQPTYGGKAREDGKALHRIRHWIPPMIRGRGEVDARPYRVKL